MKATATLRAWGNSVGIVLPKDKLKDENFSINEEVEIIVRKKTNTLKEVFGKLKEIKTRDKRSTEEILKSIDEEWSKFN